VIIDDLVIVPNWITEGKIHALANDLNEDPDILLALSGKISKDIQKIIRKRPLIFAQLIRELKTCPTTQFFESFARCGMETGKKKEVEYDRA
jgi:hypothetical protein